MERCERQFHGFDEVTGRAGIMDRKRGEETGVTTVGVAARCGVTGRSGKGRGRGGDVGAEWAPWEVSRRMRAGVSTLAPARSNSLKTSLLPRATAT